MAGPGSRCQRTLNTVFFTAILLFASRAARADLADVRKTGKLRVLAADGAPAFFSWKTGRAAGLEGEILQSFCRLQRLELAIVALPSPAAAISSLVKGQGDVAVGGLLAMDADHVEFTTEILPSRYVVITRKPASPVRKIEELRTEKIGAVRGAAATDVLSSNGLASALVEDSLPPAAVFSALKAGRVSAGIIGVEYAMPARLTDPDLQLGMYVGPKLSLAFAIRKADPQLRTALNEYIANLRRTASWNRLVLKYFGDSALDILKASR